MRALRVRMCEIVPAECDDLSIALHSRQVVFVAVVAQEPLHEPGLGVVGIHVENSVEKNLGNVPSFLGYCAGDMTPIDADHRVVARGLVEWVRLQETDREHACHGKDDELELTCQEFSSHVAKFFSGNFEGDCSENVRRVESAGVARQPETRLGPPAEAGCGGWRASWRAEPRGREAGV